MSDKKMTRYSLGHYEGVIEAMAHSAAKLRASGVDIDHILSLDRMKAMLLDLRAAVREAETRDDVAKMMRTLATANSLALKRSVKREREMHALLKEVRDYAGPKLAPELANRISRVLETSPCMHIPVDNTGE